VKGNGRDWTRPVIIRGPKLRTVADWLGANIPAPEFLLGEVFSTTSRSLLAAPTGLGKTLFCMALGFAMSEGRVFLHWRAWRDGPTKVLYLDGEMSKRLTKRRIEDTLQRAGLDPENSLYIPEYFHILSFDEMPTRPPALNTDEGEEWFERVIKDWGYEFIIFDNVQSLLDGNLAEEETWKAIQPWITSLTSRGVGQLWIDHTGHDRSRHYGSSTKTWQMDTNMLLEEIEPTGGGLAFKLKFLKARERTPENRGDFATVIITLERDQWFVQAADDDTKPKQATAAIRPKAKSPSPLGAKSYDALSDAIIAYGEPRPQSAGRSSVTEDEWKTELTRLGVLNGEKPDSQRALVSKLRQQLLEANWIAVNDGYLWSIKP
jgi:hypothetical protein